jgi:putative acetyltransferase
MRCEYDVPDEIFMVLELRKGAFQGKAGTVKYQPELNEV